MADFKLALTRRLAKRFFASAVERLHSQSVFGITVHYRSVEYLNYITGALDQLHSKGRIFFESVVRRIHCVVELGPNHQLLNGNSAYQYGIAINAYFDELSQEKRQVIGEDRYACVLARVAVHVRLVDGFAISGAWASNWKHHRTVLRIGYRRELACCEQLDCKANQIYTLQRWLRNNT